MAKAKVDGAMATAKGAIALYVAFGSTRACTWLPGSGEDWLEPGTKLLSFSMSVGLNSVDGLDEVGGFFAVVSSLELMEGGCGVDSSSCKERERRQ
ncbi:hypothetical protein AMTRI_Chr01g109990 [Amborella trichopoda]